MAKKQKIKVEGIEIVTFAKNNSDYISLTDIARYKNPKEPKDVVKNWMRNRSTIEFLGLWEKIHNPEFKGVEFDSFIYQAGGNSFVLSPSKWIETTNAKGLISRAGTGGGTIIRGRSSNNQSSKKTFSISFFSFIPLDFSKQNFL